MRQRWISKKAGLPCGQPFQKSHLKEEKQKNKSKKDEGRNKMFCKNCGTEIQGGARFCKHCGAAVNTAEIPVTPQPQYNDHCEEGETYSNTQERQEANERAVLLGRAKKVYIAAVIVGIVLGCAVAALNGMFGNIGALLSLLVFILMESICIAAFVYLPKGWRIVSNKLSGMRVVLVLPFMGWIIYYVTKLYIAACLGLFLLLRDIYRSMKYKYTE